MNCKDEISGMRELTSFQMDHSAQGNLILLRTSYIDTLAYLGIQNAPHHPDLDMMIRLDIAKKLVQELQRRIDYIESGIDVTRNDHFIM